mmetsp:Transcript_74571/g.230473  ORF Transcript_74571/g.230473 Transcript_74571/m.230473 type:complete len:299 (-) Transcript_74571:1189-2085(-)
MQQAPLSETPEVSRRGLEDPDGDPQNAGRAPSAGPEAAVVASGPRAVDGERPQAETYALALGQADLLPKAEERVASPELGLDKVDDLIQRLRLQAFYPVELPLQPLQEGVDTKSTRSHHALKVQKSKRDILDGGQLREVGDGRRLRSPLVLPAGGALGRSRRRRRRPLLCTCWPDLAARRCHLPLLGRSWCLLGRPKLLWLYEFDLARAVELHPPLGIRFVEFEEESLLAASNNDDRLARGQRGGSGARSPRAGIGRRLGRLPGGAAAGRGHSLQVIGPQHHVFATSQTDCPQPLLLV